MFGWFKQRTRPQAVNADVDDVLVTHAPMKSFPWPKGAVITAVDELVLSLPVKLFDADRPMSEFIFGPEDMQMNMPPNSECFFVRLLPGMSVSLARSCECYIVADDGAVRRLKVRRLPAEA